MMLDFFGAFSSLVMEFYEEGKILGTALKDSILYILRDNI